MAFPVRTSFCGVFLLVRAFPLLGYKGVDPYIFLYAGSEYARYSSLEKCFWFLKAPFVKFVLLKDTR